MQQTLSIIKPDAIEKNCIGKIIERFEKNGLKIIAARMVQLTKKEAQEFYMVHKERPFYNDLVEFMTSGPILASVLYGEDAIQKNRTIMGETNPENADAGTIRKDFATNVEKNAVHGSDSQETAKVEIAFFFSQDQILVR